MSTPKAAAISSASRALAAIKRAESDLERRSVGNAIFLEQSDSGVTELIGLEGLGNEAIRTCLDRIHVRVRPGADHDHRSLGDIVCAPQLGKHLEAALAGQHQIEHDQIRTNPVSQCEPARAVRSLEEAISVAESQAHKRAQVRIILANKDSVDGGRFGLGAHDGSASVFRDWLAQGETATQAREVLRAPR